VRAQRRDRVRFLVLMTDDGSAWEQASEAERAVVFEKHAAFDKAVRDRGTMVSGDALAHAGTARTLRNVEGRRVVTDGPYAESVEQLGGFYLIDLLDQDAALELCRILPESYTIEVRPAIDIEGFDPGDFA
jgi:hypothetical protein